MGRWSVLRTGDRWDERASTMFRAPGFVLCWPVVRSRGVQRTCGLRGSSLPQADHRGMKSVPDERIQVLSEKQRANGEYVLYWMQASVRCSHNHALEWAIYEANRAELPLLTVFGIYEKFPEANERHFAFLLEGLKDVQESLSKRGLRMIVLHQPPVDAVLKLEPKARMIVTDRGYTRILRDWRKKLAKGAGCEVIQIESDVIVPVEAASNKEETAARTIRPKIERQLDTFMKKVEQQEPNFSMDADPDLCGMEVLDVSDVDAVLTKLDVDRTVKRVSSFIGGESEARKHLNLFIEKRLAKYGRRNEPSNDVSSDMSPYLHFGHISPIEVALRAKPLRKKYTEEVKSFLEELIVRRELSMNLVYFNENYDSFEGVLPNYARITLKEHAGDRRPYVYSEQQLERARSHDEYWNAAQTEMVLTGKMHGYMRMYWGKKILEWTDTPQNAFDIALRLNNKYQLDGRDANSFTGVAWCFGKHDQGWKERDVFGKVRYMNSAGLERKFDMKGYLNKVSKLRKQHGFGKSIASYFEAAEPRNGGKEDTKDLASGEGEKRSTRRRKA